MNRNCLVYGAGGHARVILDVLRSQEVKVTHIIADKPDVAVVNGLPVQSAASFDFGSVTPFSFFIAIGNNSIRKDVFLRLSTLGKALNIVHQFSCVSTEVELGCGVAIMPGVVVNTGARIGDNAILNTSCSVDHDCIIGPHSHLCPGVHLAGNVVVGSGTMIGTGAAVIPGVKIGENCTIGAGSVVVRDVQDGSVAYGTPCRLRNSSKGRI